MVDILINIYSKEIIVIVSLVVAVVFVFALVLIIIVIIIIFFSIIIIVVITNAYFRLFKFILNINTDMFDFAILSYSLCCK